MQLVEKYTVVMAFSETQSHPVQAEIKLDKKFHVIFIEILMGSVLHFL